MKSSKGSAFEREICKKLSMWWTDGKRDDVFWRSSNSGGRATMRAKSGKRTHGHCGDIAAVDPIGAPLTSLVTLELKRGYTGTSFADVIDKPAHAKQNMFEAFVEQAETASVLSGSQFWALITRRNKKIALIFIPKEFLKYLEDRGCDMVHGCPIVKLKTSFLQGNKTRKTRTVFGFSLDDFLERFKIGYVFEDSMD